MVGLTVTVADSSAPFCAAGMPVAELPRRLLTSLWMCGRTFATSVFTHAGCKEVFNHPRNKSGCDMKALANKGGAMGVYMLPFLAPTIGNPCLPTTYFI
jgi:Membrane dipeptidase (Peptidase family M19)